MCTWQQPSTCSPPGGGASTPGEGSIPGVGGRVGDILVSCPLGTLLDCSDFRRNRGGSTFIFGNRVGVMIQRAENWPHLGKNGRPEFMSPFQKIWFPHWKKGLIACVFGVLWD